MKYFLSLFIILSTLSAFASTFDMSVDGKKKSLEFQKFEDVTLSKTCFKTDSKKPTCQAFQVLSKKITETRPNVPLAGHPAAYFCGSAGGLNRILKDPANRDYDFCEFKDKSMVDAWDLYYHFHKR